MQEATVGLIQAIDRYDSNQGKFSTYATYWIKNGIFEYFNSLSTIKIPQEVKAIKKSVYMIIDDYVQKHGEMPDSEYISKQLNKIKEKQHSPEDISLLLDSYRRLSVSSLYDSVGEEGEKIDLIKVEDPDAIKEFSSDDLKAKVEKIFAESSGYLVDEKILKGIFYENKTLDELRDELGLSREAVRKYYERGIRFLKNKLHKEE